MIRELLFPTPIYTKMVKDPKKLNKYLFPLIKAWSKTDKGEENQFRRWLAQSHRHEF